MLMNDIHERRETTRLQLKTPVTLLDEDKKKSAGTVIDLSATGALIKTDEEFAINKKYTLSIQLTGEHSNLLIDNLSVFAVRQDADRIGVQFTDTMEWLTLFYVYRAKFNLDQE